MGSTLIIVYSGAALFKCKTFQRKIPGYIVYAEETTSTIAECLQKDTQFVDLGMGAREP